MSVQKYRSKNSLNLINRILIDAPDTALLSDESPMSLSTLVSEIFVLEFSSSISGLDSSSRKQFLFLTLRIMPRTCTIDKYKHK